MAKISTLKFEINGEQLTANVNVNSGGEFSVRIPNNVANALGLQSELRAKTLSEITSTFYGHLDRYKKASTEHELLIFVRYGSSGNYSYNKNGGVLFGGYNHKYELRTGNFGSDGMDALGFDFEVVIKETIDGVPNYFVAVDAELDNSLYGEAVIGKYRKSGTFYSKEKYKQISFSEKSLATLMNAREKIRSLSQLLFEFIEMDTLQIEQVLANQKLIG